MLSLIKCYFQVLLLCFGCFLNAQSDSKEPLQKLQTQQDKTDSITFSTHYQKALLLVKTSPSEAINEVKASLAINNLSESCPLCEMKALALQGNIYFRQHQTDSAELIYTKLKNAASKNKHLKYLSMSLNNLGSCNNANGNYTQAISFYRRAIDVKRQIKDTLGVARGLKNLGSNLIKFGDFDNGLKYLLEAKDLRIKLKDTAGVATALNSIGVLYKKQNDLDNALLYFEEALKTSKLLKNDKALVSPYSSLGTVYEAKEDYHKALAYYEKGLEYSEAANFKFGMALTLLNSGNVLLKMEAYKKAKTRLLRGYEMAKEIKREYFITEALQKLGWCYFKEGNIGRAIDYTKKSIIKAEEKGDLPILKDSYNKLAIIYESQQKHKEALSLWKKHHAVKDSLFNEEHIRNSAEIQTKHRMAQEQLKHDNEIALKENQVKLLKKEEELKSKTIWGLSFSIFLVALLSFLVWKNQRQKLILNHNEKTISESKLKNATLEKEHLALEIEMKSKELNAFALNILQRIEFIDKLRDSIKSLKKEGSNLGNEKLELIDMKLRETQSFEQDKELFKMKLDQEQDTFLRRMKVKYPDLTKDEIRLAALLKIDFSSKEVATILNIEPKSVDMKRYRLRKKMGLDKEINLNDFLKLI